MREVSEASKANEQSCLAATGCWDRQLASSGSGAARPCAQAQAQTTASRILMRSSLSTPSQLVNGLIDAGDGPQGAAGAARDDRVRRPEAGTGTDRRPRA